jgi:hypothetical protein
MKGRDAMTTPTPDPTLTAAQIAEETMIEEAEEYFFGFPLDEAAWRRNGRLHAAKDAEIAALRDRLARAEERLAIHEGIQTLLMESGGKNAFGSLLLSAADEHAQGWEGLPHMAEWAALVRANCDEIISYINDLDEMDATPTDGAAGEGEASDGQ